MYCKYCGKPIDEDSAFCRHCGKRQTNDKFVVEDEPRHKKKESKEILPPKREKQAKNNSRNALFIFCGGLLVLIAIIVWVVCTFQDADKKIADITIDKVSKELAEAIKKYDKLDSYHEGLASVCKDEKWGFIDKLGQEIIPCKYDDANDFEYGIAVVKYGEKEGAINNNGKVVIPFVYDWIKGFAEDSTAVAKKEGKFGIIDLKGSEIIPFVYDYCDNFHEGMAAVVQNGKLGFVNRKGDLVIECQYENLDSPIFHNYTKFVNGLAAVRKDGDWGYIDITGEVIIPFNEYLEGMPFYHGTSIITRKVDILPRDGLDISNTEFAFIDCYGKQISPWGKVGSLWDDGNVWKDGYLYYIEKDYWYGTYGLLDLRGNTVIPSNEYFRVCYRSGSGYYYVKVTQNSLEGLFDIRTKKLTVPIEYDYLSFEIHEGMIVAVKDKRCGFINFKNEVVIPFEYEGARGFSEGFAVVERFGKYGYVDRYGNDTFSIN